MDKTIPSWQKDVVADIKASQPSNVTANASGVGRAEQTYTVKAGDTLSKIAKEHLGSQHAQ